MIGRGAARARCWRGLPHGAAWDHVAMHTMPHTVCMSQTDGHSDRK